MPRCCAVTSCGTKGVKGSNSFFGIPGSPKHGTAEFRKLKTERRKKWIEALTRAGVTAAKLKNVVTCDKHFVTGRPASIRDVNHPDWFPNQNMGYEVKQAPIDLRKRYKKREKIRHVEQSYSKYAKFEESDVIEATPGIHLKLKTEISHHVGAKNNKLGRTNVCCKSVQTDMSMEDIKNLEKACHDVNV